MKLFKRKNTGSNSGWEYAGLGFEFVGMFLVCTVLGWWLDSLIWPEKQWLMLGGIFLGFAAGLYHILLRTSQLEKMDQPSRPESKKKEENQTMKIERLESEMEDVGNRIEDFIKEETRRRK